MPAVNGDTGINAAIAQVVSTDDKVQKRVRKIVNALLDDIEWLLLYGTPKERITLARSVVPTMMKALTASEGQDDGMKKAYEEMMADLRGDAELGGGTAD